MHFASVLFYRAWSEYILWGNEIGVLSPSLSLVLLCIGTVGGGEKTFWFLLRGWFTPCHKSVAGATVQLTLQCCACHGCRSTWCSITQCGGRLWIAKATWNLKRKSPLYISHAALSLYYTLTLWMKIFAPRPSKSPPTPANSAHSSHCHVSKPLFMNEDPEITPKMLIRY